MNLRENHKNHLVVATTTKLVFPDYCPVCGSPATQRSFTTNSFRNPLKFLRASFWGPRHTMPIRDRKRLEVPVCDRHHAFSEDKERVRSLLFIALGVAMVFTLFLGSIIAFNLYDELPVDLRLYFLFSASFLTMIGSYRGLGAGALERAISIVRYDPSSQAAILRLKHRSYVEELLRLNPTTTRPIER
ncbi:MAG: hypothetical protein ACXAEN_16950 [Candidatus Thorarchaeota archaeon]